MKGQLMLSLCLGTPGVNDWTSPLNEMQTPHLFTASLCSGVASSIISILLDLLRLGSDHRPWEMTLIGVGLLRNTLEFLKRRVEENRASVQTKFIPLWDARGMSH